MKYANILLQLLTLTLMVSCASKPISSRAIEIATPVETDRPSVEKIVKVVEVVSTTATRVDNSVSSAELANKESKKQIADLESINKDFATKIESLEEETRVVFDHLKLRYEGVIIRLRESNDNVNTSLTNALDHIDDLKDDLTKLEGEVSEHDVTVAKAEDEKEKLRELVKVMVKAKTLDETYKERAESRMKYVWFFWILLVATVVYIVLKIKIR